MRPRLSILEVQRSGIREGKVQSRSDGKRHKRLSQAKGFLHELSRKDMLLCILYCNSLITAWKLDRNMNSICLKEFCLAICFILVTQMFEHQNNTQQLENVSIVAVKI